MRRFGYAAGCFTLLLTAANPNAALGQSGKPTISAVANVASYAAGSISPGEMIVIFGTGLGPAQAMALQLDQNGRVANTLSQVQVLFDGNPAPLIYVSATQISAMVPYGLSGKTTTQVQVIYRGAASDPFQKAVASSAPGIFTADASGTGQVAMTNSDGSLNTATNPATAGSYVTFYLTGEGQTSPPGSDGNIATGAAKMDLSVTVLIAGRTAQLLYAGSAPGNVNGFCQINAAIPPDLQYGGNLPLAVQIGGVPSQAGVTVAVSGPPAPIPGAPQSLTETVNSSGQVVLPWTPADSIATWLHIERQIAGSSFTEIATVPATATTYTDQAVTAGAAYQYRIRAENDYGFSPYSAVVTATISVAQLSPPSNLQAVAVSQTQINLTWSNANTNATRFHIERTTGTAGSYGEIGAVAATTTGYQDTTVQANTAYTYRARSEGASGFSAYSNESSAATPAVPLPPAPTLQGTATSGSQGHLSWTTTATGIIRFRVERRTTTGAYAEIAQPSATSTTFDDSGLNPSTTYLYRMRVETGAGLSPYSNEVTVTTLQALPAAPTNLQATATSTTQVTLTWTNNAPTATAIRVEMGTGSSTTFMDIGAAVNQTSTGVSSLQANTTYSFRVRAQNSAGYSGYSNVATATTLPIPKTVFLIHGLHQSHLDMVQLAANLNNVSFGLDPKRFRFVDAGFDFSDCVDINLLFCSSSCTLSGGAQRLAQYILNANPPGDIVLIGFSLGGLLARDVIVNNRIILNGRKIHLVTIATPNLGYPYVPLLDDVPFCSAIVSAMYGDWRAQLNTVELSQYLLTMTNQWSASGFPSTGRAWFAASGRACSNPIRHLSTEGCRDQNPYSDGVVCQDSASYNVSTATGTSPNYFWSDPSGVYVHSSSGFTTFLFCDTSGTQYLALWNPPPTGTLFTTLISILNGL